MKLKGTTVTISTPTATIVSDNNTPDMDRLLSEIKEMSTHPKWIEYLNKQNSKSKQRGRGASKKSQIGNA